MVRQTKNKFTTYPSTSLGAGNSQSTKRIFRLLFLLGHPVFLLVKFLLNILVRTGFLVINNSASLIGSVKKIPPPVRFPQKKRPRGRPRKIHLFKFKIPFPKIHVPKLYLPKPRTPKIPALKLTFPNFRFWKFDPLILLKIRYLTMGIGVGLILTIYISAISFLNSLPHPALLKNRNIPVTSKIYDRNGVLLFEFYGSQNRTPIKLTVLPKYVERAVLAIEDKNFYHHPGVDIRSIARALLNNLEGKPIQGGSTLTQQLIKSALLTPEVTFGRKAKEGILAIWAERIYTKDQILEMYLNQVSFGGQAYGIEAASQTYFNKSAKDLDLAEAALLAGLPSAPTTYSPIGLYPNLAIARQKEVLKRMVEENYISKAQGQEAENAPLDIKSPQIPIRAPHFVMFIKDQIVRKYGERALLEGGLNIQTTLDIGLQDFAQKEITDGVNRQKYLNVGNGAAIIENPKTGEILSMVGGADFFATGSGNVNIATALRSPGSSIKVVNYATAFQKGFSPASIIDDSPITYQTAGLPPYSPRNYDGKFHGLVTIRTALANSYNIPAVKVLNKVGVKEMIEQGKKMGITTWNDENRFGLSLTLGGGEVTILDLTSVYGVLANGGIEHSPVTILKITDYRGKVFEEFVSPNPHLALPSEVAYLLANILSDRYARAKTFGVNSPLNIEGRSVAAKTGTTDTTRDNWTIGFTPSIVAAVWVGNNDGKPMSPYLESGNTGAAPIWHNIMAAILKDKPDEKWELPEKVIPVQVCSINGLLPCENCPTVTEYFVKGTEPAIHCKIEPTPTPTQTTVYLLPQPDPPKRPKEIKLKRDVSREFSFEVKSLTQAQD